MTKNENLFLVLVASRATKNPSEAMGDWRVPTAETVVKLVK